jgi:hypothetical protein
MFNCATLLSPSGSQRRFASSIAQANSLFMFGIDGQETLLQGILPNTHIAWNIRLDWGSIYLASGSYDGSIQSGTYTTSFHTAEIQTAKTHTDTTTSH